MSAGRLWLVGLFVGAALGLAASPLILWGAVPSAPARIESADGFTWIGKDRGTGAPLLLREQFDGRQILAGSERPGIPAAESVECYSGEAAALEPLRQAAAAKGRIEGLTLDHGYLHPALHRLAVTTDDLGSPTTTYLYRCDERGARPLLVWSPAPSFGLLALGLGWLAWMAGWMALLTGLAKLTGRLTRGR